MTDLPDLELTLPARAENVGVIRHVLGAVAETLHVGDEQLDDMRLAVSEACANAVIHAYVDGAGLMEVRVRARMTDLEISVRDHGGGMAPRTDSPGLGVGLPLMATLAASMELIAPEGGGTEVRMRFPLPHESAGGPPRPAEHGTVTPGTPPAPGSADDARPRPLAESRERHP
ncbi:Anti-sigma F factor [Paraconexibacter sp. AEG42_29]|uniref:Anti-sigma F factor n=1 Tax=Paraconexibacter sp. AEG42_29 TaxID=2997339 RepID=A0AAU7AT37_9ACTN